MRDERVGAEENSFDPTEDSGIGADPQSQAKNREDRKPRTAPKHPDAEAEVLQRRLDHRYSSLIAVVLLGLLDAAKAATRLGAGVLRGHAFSQVQFNSHLQV